MISHTCLNFNTSRQLISTKRSEVHLRASSDDTMRNFSAALMRNHFLIFLGIFTNWAVPDVPNIPWESYQSHISMIKCSLSETFRQWFLPTPQPRRETFGGRWLLETWWLGLVNDELGNFKEPNVSKSPREHAVGFWWMSLCENSIRRPEEEWLSQME